MSSACSGSPTSSAVQYFQPTVPTRPPRGRARSSSTSIRSLARGWEMREKEAQWATAMSPAATAGEACV